MNSTRNAGTEQQCGTLAQIKPCVVCSSVSWSTIVSFCCLHRLKAFYSCRLCHFRCNLYHATIDIDVVCIMGNACGRRHPTRTSQFSERRIALQCNIVRFFCSRRMLINETQMTTQATPVSSARYMLLFSRGP
ncbi:hypothetical protein DPMN_026657 [Dreissena polymorpha]|uniref:Uncharacterized protein n=1 Tax=Dreissena polymorpha TaxID=45954 RepID=A0A9D4RDQ6_DREPO|nr:hypothetical protein DPMN_026657 [Dreissena polymorpha]